MPLRITRATDPIEVKTITMCLYAEPGVGKTSMAFTAADPLLLDFDAGAYRAKNRRDAVQVQHWGDVTAITEADLKPYKTVIVDTAGRALDCLTADIIDEDPKLGRGGNLSLQGYGALKTRFVAWTKMIRGFGLDVILLCHSDEQRKGDELIVRLDMQGGSKGEVYKAADVMGRIYIDKGRRTLNFSPTDTAFGKNPAQLPVMQVPDYAETPHFLAGVITDIKASLNAMSAEQTAVATTLGEWAEKIGAAKTCADFDALVAAGKDLPEDVRKNVGRMVGKAAKAKGIAINKTTGLYDMAETKGKAA